MFELLPGDIPNMEVFQGIQNTGTEDTLQNSQIIQENVPVQLILEPKRKAVSMKMLDGDCSLEEVTDQEAQGSKIKFVQTEIHQLGYEDGSPCGLEEENNVQEVQKFPDSNYRLVPTKILLQPSDKELPAYFANKTKGNIVKQIQMKQRELPPNKKMPTYIDHFSSFINLAGKQWQFADTNQKTSETTKNMSSLKVRSVAKMQAVNKANVKGGERVKRPLNAFMVFSHHERRKMKERKLQQHHSKVSQQLGREWRALGELGRGPYIQEAERLRLLHLQEHPGYKYCPRPRKLSVDVSSRSREGPARQAIPHSSLQAAWPWLAAWLKKKLPHLRHKETLGELEIVDIMTDHIQV